MTKVRSLGGCRGYLVGNLRVNFPLESPTCQYCPLIRYEDPYKRYRCWRTGEWLLRPFEERGENCPLTFESEE